MAYDIYIILLTGFAVLGLYCFIDTIICFFSLKDMPASVLIMKNDLNVKVLKKLKFAEQNIPNNYILLYPFDEEDCDNQTELLEAYLENVLDVKNVNKQ